MPQTKFHTRTKQETKLQFCVLQSSQMNCTKTTNNKNKKQQTATNNKQQTCLRYLTFMPALLWDITQR
jgi:hypothetical protein